jgi:5-methylcytosine-specific restriction protein A
VVPFFDRLEDVFDSDLSRTREFLEGTAAVLDEVGVDDVLDVLKAVAPVMRLLERVQVAAVGVLQREDVFVEHGYGRKEASALADLTGDDHVRAQKVVNAADAVRSRPELNGGARLPATAARFAAGDASVEHVNTVVGLLDSPAVQRLGVEERDAVEARLAGLVVGRTPRQVRMEGKKILAQVAPDDQAPDYVNELRITPLPDGGARFSGRIEDPAEWAVIAKVLEAKTAPLTADDDRPRPERQAGALVEVFGWVAAHGDRKILPTTGGNRPQVIVITGLTDLENRAAGRLDTGAVLDPGAVRRLCCDAQVIPVVMGGPSEVLDVGRDQRTVDPAIRRAVLVRDRGCAHPGCARPPNWGEIHHIHEWAHGGSTCLSNLVMLCRTHHRLQHSTGWQIRIADDGAPEFLPPPFLDPTRTPRRQTPLTPTT